MFFVIFGDNIIFFMRMLYECQYLEDCFYNCLDTSGNNYHSFLIFLSEVAEIHVLNMLKLYEKAPITVQLLSDLILMSNFQLTVNVKYRIMSHQIFYWTKTSTQTMST